MSFDLTWAPLLPWQAIAALAAIATALLGFAIVRRTRGVILRIVAFAVLFLALLNPRLVTQETVPQPDIAVIITDLSPSQSIGERRAQTATAREALRQSLEALGDVDLREAEVTGGGSDGSEGTRLLATLNRTLGDIPVGRFAGAVVLTDGQIHDVSAIHEQTLPRGPLHVILSGARSEVDRRLVVETAPGYGLVGKEVTLTYRVEDSPSPGSGSPPVRVQVRRDGEPLSTVSARPGLLEEISIPLDHGGPTVVELEVEAIDGELSTINNRAAVSINGVRDRLRVLLVSGQPHPGERTWRNLLKSDPAVDLVHFTILRPPEKDDFTPINELALISFPVQELFEEKLSEFDLIVFDRYIVRDILPLTYFYAIADYVREGGAILVATGPEFAGMRSLYRTPLEEVMPASPTGNVIETGFQPVMTALGRRHPVTAALTLGSDRRPTWGRWFRQIEAAAETGVTIMAGSGEAPLLVLERVGKGRVAQMMSDHVWLWARGFENGGPHAELIRRLAHWLMKEPDLEEEALRAHAKDGKLTVERRSLETDEVTVTVTAPSGRAETVVLESGEDGRAVATLAISDPGLYRIDDGTRTALAAAGIPNAPELMDIRATEDHLRPLVEATGGGLAWIADGTLPKIRRVRPGGDTAGRGWIGMVKNGAFEVTGISQIPLLPAFLFLALGLGGLAAAWWREGR